MYKELTKRLVEKMLNSEMQNYLGYDKNQHSNSDNARNGISSKKLITQQGKIEIDVPRDRNSNFNPVIVGGFLEICVSLFYKVLVKINSIFKFYHKMSNCCISILNGHCSFFCYIFNC